MKLITISREYGSGGGVIGRELAETLGFAYYDKEIIHTIAKDLNLSEKEVFQLTEENKATFLQMPFENYGGIDTHSLDVLRVQRQVLRNIAEKGEDCVVVGRSGDVILDDYDPLKIFVYADSETCIANIRATVPKYKDTPDKHIYRDMKRINSVRASYYELVSGEKWGRKENYDLCINTSGKDMRTLVKPIAEYATAWFRLSE